MELSVGSTLGSHSIKIFWVVFEILPINNFTTIVDIFNDIKLLIFKMAVAVSQQLSI